MFLLRLNKPPLKREPSYTLGGNVNWGSHYGEQDGGSLKIGRSLAVQWLGLSVHGRQCRFEPWMGN